MTAEQHRRASQRQTKRVDDAERNRLEKALEIGLEDTFPRPMRSLPFSPRQRRDYRECRAPVGPFCPEAVGQVISAAAGNAPRIMSSSPGKKMILPADHYVAPS